jgi:hypothetical protein
MRSRGGTAGSFQIVLTLVSVGVGVDQDRGEAVGQRLVQPASRSTPRSSKMSSEDGRHLVDSQA